MPNLSPIKSRIDQARSLYRNIANENDLFYLFLGRTQPWNEGVEVPETPNDTQDVLANFRHNILSAKRITENDVVYLARRIDWESGTVYERFDNTIDMDGKDFYVYNTTNYCIYKCLNRSDYIDGSTPVPSTYQPNDTSPERFITADGYWWKLIYYIPESDRLKFLTNDYLPVRFFSSSTSFDCSGYIEKIVLNSVGSGYTSPPTVIIHGDGKGAAAYCDINTSGGLDTITMVSSGFGYTYARIEFVGIGSGATAAAVLAPQDIDIGLNENIAAYAQATGGAIEFVEVLDGGVNYQPDTIFKVLGDGKNATLGTIKLVEGGSGNVSSVVVSSGGRYYTEAEIQTSGNGEGGLFKVLIGPIYGHGGNVPTELMATTIGIVVEVQDFLSDFFINNDFRQVGLIKNIQTYGATAKAFIGQTCDASYIIDVSNPEEYTVDDIIESLDGGLFRVIMVYGTNIKILPIYDVITENSILYNRTTSTELGNFVSIISYPEFNYRSGDLLYVNNILPITRSASQTETIKLFLSF